jgi:hypothetical protein
MILALLDLVESKSIEMAATIATLISDSVQLPIDLPQVPLVVMEQSLREDISTAGIIEALGVIATELPERSNGTLAVHKLIAKYRKLQSIIESAGEPEPSQLATLENPSLKPGVETRGGLRLGRFVRRFLRPVSSWRHLLAKRVRDDG